MSFGIWQLVLLLVFTQWTQAATIKDFRNTTVAEYGPECALRLKEMGIEVKFLQDTCKCEDNSCGCCFEGSWPGSESTETFCMKGTLIVENFELQINATLNDQNLGAFVLSGRNPPPFCFPIPFPIQIPLFMCIQGREIYLEGNNMHLCADIMMRFGGFDFLHVPLNCMWIGVDGVQLVGQK